MHCCIKIASSFNIIQSTNNDSEFGVKAILFLLDFACMGNYFNSRTSAHDEIRYNFGFFLINIFVPEQELPV